MRRVPRFRLRCDGDATLNVDGEVLEGLPLEVEVLPRALTLLL